MVSSEKGKLFLYFFMLSAKDVNIERFWFVVYKNCKRKQA